MCKFFKPQFIKSCSGYFVSRSKESDLLITCVVCSLREALKYGMIRHISA